MNQFFYKDRLTDENISWDRLLIDLKQTKFYNKYCYSNTYYDIFKHIVLSLVLNREIELLDTDFSEDELMSLIGLTREDLKKYNEVLDFELEVKSKEELISLVKASSDKWQLKLYTSGTTGLPKCIQHNKKTITRFVKTSDDKQKDIWGFAYNPTHMAGIQVFFQALFNGNRIIRLFGLEQNQIFKEIADNEITNISATPTFFRLLIGNSSNKFLSVKRITSGGEKFDGRVMEKTKKLFPKAKITNVYASTEAGTIFASENDVFEIRDEFKELVKIHDNEILLHKSLMGRADVLNEEWYGTGDLVEILKEEPLSFMFLARKSEMINVGGYKVNPQEVEEAILGIDGVMQAQVYGKKNSVLGNIVIAEVVCIDNKLDENLIRVQLSGMLQEFKIPRVIKIVDSIKVTRTGKQERKNS